MTDKQWHLEDVTEMKSGGIVFMLLSGPLTHGAAGLANSFIERASSLSEAGWTVTILVDVWQVDLKWHVEALVDSGRLHPKVAVRNLYFDLAAQAGLPDGYMESQFSSPLLSDYIGRLDARYDDSNGQVVRYYDKHLYRYFGYVDERSTPLFLDELIDKKRVKRLYFSPGGRLIRGTGYRNESPVWDEFYNESGVVYCRIRYGSDEKVATVTVREGRSRYRNLNRDESLLGFWLSSCFEIGTEDFVICEYAFKFSDLQEFARKSGVPTIYTLHSSHLGPPHGAGAPIKPELGPTFHNAEDMDAIVVLTPQQRFDIRKRFPELQNVHTIPHAAPQPLKVSRTPVAARETGLVVVVGRLDQVKGQRLVIEKFSRLLERHPGARLELWGRGNDEGNIRRLISEQSLSDSVSLKGFTNDTSTVFERAEIALFPSSFEGQSLTLMEAMRAGCVPVCFDFKYGARMLVDDLENGIIVERGDVVDMIDSACVLLDDPTSLASMSKASRVKMAMFSKDRLVRDWENLFFQLSASRK
ncbi:glycosyltransferase [Brevibacterium casei]|uniref:Glycosyltransferase involved in cell wall bisynthesis n=1 Tax=Brevibacterium casei CIP 102111 TaxID=1255625 RepID=A0A2H1JKW2_9MICO|nr:glycosyltransferase [Brevibacterium casei]QPR39221.1 glycosyltransferase [Brevibacterium casei]QPR43387.1 glycosyltransferase [Brevibacterium casei]SMX87732.1 Glycosyltransferase involved in cell wall bisynthesis [Brevibacterium casei CIP 102111]